MKYRLHVAVWVLGALLLLAACGTAQAPTPTVTHRAATMDLVTCLEQPVIHQIAVASTVPQQYKGAHYEVHSCGGDTYVVRTVRDGSVLWTSDLVSPGQIIDAPGEFALNLSWEGRLGRG